MLLVDVQERLLSAMAEPERVVAKADIVLKAATEYVDLRVTCWKPTKWVAKLRTRNTSDNLLMLKITMDQGHGGASDRFDRLKEVAEVYAVGLMVTGKIDQVA